MAPIDIDADAKDHEINETIVVIKCCSMNTQMHARTPMSETCAQVQRMKWTEEDALCELNSSVLPPDLHTRNEEDNTRK